MQLSGNPLDNTQTLKKTVWLLCGVALGALEFFIPRLPFFPWLKPGFANIITILWIIEFGAIDAIVYAVLRTWIVGFFFGFSFITMALSLSGGMLATAAMALLWQIAGRRGWLGLIGLGITGAFFHNLGQLAAVYALLSTTINIWYQMPVMLLASLGFGGMVGWLAAVVRPVLLVSPLMPMQAKVAQSLRPVTVSDWLFSMLLFGLCLGIVFVHDRTTLIFAAAGAMVLALIVKKGSVAVIVYPFTKFWIFFLFVASINLFFSYGKVVGGVPFVTEEGITLTLHQWLRLYIWLQITVVVTRFNFHAVMFGALKRIFPGHQETLSAGVLALEYFPAIVSDSRRFVREIFKRRKTGAPQSRLSLPGLVDALYRIVVDAINRPQNMK